MHRYRRCVADIWNQPAGNEQLLQGIFEYTSVTFIGAGTLNDVI